MPLVSSQRHGGEQQAGGLPRFNLSEHKLKFTPMALSTFTHLGQPGTDFVSKAVGLHAAKKGKERDFLGPLKKRQNGGVRFLVSSPPFWREGGCVLQHSWPIDVT